MPLISKAKLAALAILSMVVLAPMVPANAAGTLPIAMAQQRDVNGDPVLCQVYFYVAGTVASPQNSYSDYGLTQNPNNQLACDQTGRVPMFWLADGLVHVRMVDAAGVPIIDTTMYALGPSSGGGGGGGTVDPTTIAQTGDLKGRYGTGLISGWVRCNGLTIGNGSSGATERANADTQTAFVYLYNTDPNLVVSGGRTGNALNDYNANKTIATPDWRGRALAFLDDMGNSPAGRLTASFFGTSATTLGAPGGSESTTLTAAQIPSITSTASPSLTANVTTNVWVAGNSGDSTPINVGQGGANNGLTVSIAAGFSVAKQPSAGTATGTVSSTSTNTSGGAHRTVQPTMLATIYIKL
ncbi:MAG: hypothetical protein PS018_20270 [bacterium]|nr:hypothetical protein [bacterium]